MLVCITFSAPYTVLATARHSCALERSHRCGINAGWIPGPRIFAAGPALGSTGGHADPTDGLNRSYQPITGPDQSINSPDDARKAVRLHYKQNVDVVKVVASGGVQDESGSVDNPQLTEEEIAAVVQTAHDYGYVVGVHAHGSEAMRRAVLAGVDSIEHGTFMSESVMDLMKAHGTYFVPTMYTATFVTEKAKRPGAYSPTVTRKALLVGPRRSGLRTNTGCRLRAAPMRASFRMARTGGISRCWWRQACPRCMRSRRQRSTRRG